MRSANDAPAAPPAHRSPVFVDVTGRRRRRLRWAGGGLLAVLFGYGVLLILSVVGGPVPPGALLPLPGNGQAQTSTTVTNPATSDPSAGATGAAGTVPAAGGRTTAPAGGATTAGTSATTAAAASTAANHKPTAPPGRSGKSSSPAPHGH